MPPLTFTGSRVGRLAAGAIAASSLALLPAAAHAVPPTWQLSAGDGNADLGSVLVGQSTTKTLQLRNTGNTELRIASGALKLSAGPIVLDSTTCVDRWLDPGITCTVTLSFKPTAAGATTQTLTGLHDNGTVSLAITGTGEAPPVETPVPTPPPAPVITPEPPSIIFKPTLTKADAVVFAPKIKSIDVTDNGKFKVPLLCPAELKCQVSASLTIAQGEIKGKPDPGADARRTIAKLIRTDVDPNRKETVKLAINATTLKLAERYDTDELSTTVRIVTQIQSDIIVTTRQISLQIAS